MSNCQYDGSPTRHIPIGLVLLDVLAAFSSPGRWARRPRFVRDRFSEASGCRRWLAAGGEGPLVGTEGEDVKLTLVCAAGQGHRRYRLPRLKGDVGGVDLRPDLL
jgi:hypothetical protein